MNDSGSLVLPRHFHRTAAGQHNDDIFIHRRKRVQERKLIFRQAHIFPVDALGFAALVKAEEQQHRFGTHGKLAGFGAKPCTALAAAVKARLKAYDSNALRTERIKRVIDLGGVYKRAACALIAGSFRKVADDGNAVGGFKRQSAVVFEQNRRFLGKFCGKTMMLSLVIVLVIKCPSGLKHHIENFVYPLVEKLLAYHAVAHSLRNVAVGLTAGIGHFEIISGDECLDPVVVAAPVGDHHTVVAPLAVEDILQEVGVFIGVLAV